MVKNKSDSSNSIYLALECKSRAEKLIYYLKSNNRDRRGSLSRKDRRNYF